MAGCTRTLADSVGRSCSRSGSALLMGYDGALARPRSADSRHVQDVQQRRGHPGRNPAVTSRPRTSMTRYGRPSASIDHLAGAARRYGRQDPKVRILTKVRILSMECGEQYRDDCGAASCDEHW